MILESIVTTRNADGTIHIAPMGPLVDPGITRLTLRPFQTSTTYQNLRRTTRGVVHVTDDVELLARAAVNRIDVPPRTIPCEAADGFVLAEACRWYAFRVTSIDDTPPGLTAGRAALECEIVDRGRIRDFFGFNRAKHAVVEAAILATRLQFLPPDEIRSEFRRLSVLIEKTGGEQERRGFQFLLDFVNQQLPGRAAPMESSHTNAPRSEFGASLGAPIPGTTASGSAGVPPGERRRDERPASDANSSRLSREGQQCRVEVTAPSRLHFGLLSFAGPGRSFGGVGVMLDAPAVRLEITPHRELLTEGRHAERALAFARRWADHHGLPFPPCRIVITEAPEQHVGLGVGTQLGLAVAAGLGAFSGLPPASPAELALSVGRGQRSAVGTYGFVLGGLIAERGKLPGEALSPLDCRLELPDAWRFVLICSHTVGRISGSEEALAFAELPSVPDEVTETLTREVRDRMLPAAAQGNFAEFADSVFRYGYTAGLCFADRQGGAYRGERLERLVELAGQLGVRGVGQSSWGPTLFAILPNQAEAEVFCARFRAATQDAELVITSANRAGHRIVTTTGDADG